MRFQIELDDRTQELDLTSTGPGRYTAYLGSGASRRALEVTVLGDRPTLAVLIEGRVLELIPLGGGQIGARGARTKARPLDAAEARLAHKATTRGAGTATIKAPMPGRIVKISVSEGQAVAAGQAALVIEAMKMENELVCGQGGEVRKVFVKPGDTVERGAPLIEIG